MRDLCKRQLSVYPFTNSRYLFQEEDIRKSLEENARISEEYQKYFDLEVVMEDQDIAFRTIIQSLDKLAKEGIMGLRRAKRRNMERLTVRTQEQPGVVTIKFDMSCQILTNDLNQVCPFPCL